MANTYYISRLITSRYFKREDIAHFLTTLSVLSRSGFDCNPRVAIFKASSYNKRSLDILLDTGVQMKDLEKKYKGSSLFLQSFFSVEYYSLVKEVKTSDWRLSGDKKNYDSILFGRVMEFLLSEVDSSVEMRGVRDK